MKKSAGYISLFVTISLMQLMSSCKKEEDVAPLTVPNITTSPATAVTKTSASGGGNVTSDGGSPILSRGIVWATSSSPDVSSPNITSNGTGGGSFASEITGLTENTTYFVRAYAINAQGPAYGNEVTFTTLASVPPSVETIAITEIGFSNVSVSGNVSATGDTPIIERGVVVGLSPKPSVTNTLNSKATSAGGTGTFTVSVTGLGEGVKYYARAYAKNGTLTAYGADTEFTTKSVQALALAFDGVDDYVEVPHNSSLNLGSAFTLEAWVYLENNSIVNQIFLHKWVTNQYTLELLNNKLNFVVRSGGNFYVLESPDNFPRGHWVHIAGVRDGSTMRIYEGGLLKNSKAISGSTTTATSGSLIIGRRSETSSSHMKGKMDEIRIWNVARTTTQIDVNKTNNTPQVDPGLVAWYQLNGEAFANQTNSGLTFFEDLTSNDNNGTLKNFALTGTTSNWTETYTRITTFTVGMKYQGGIVAYVSGIHGFIVAPMDQSNGASWGCVGVTITGANGFGIGTGYQNTLDIVAGCSTAGIAARLCNDLVLDGYSDWYLPSYDELNELYIRRASINAAVTTIVGGTTIASSYYWSSSEYNGNDAYEQNMSNGTQQNYVKTYGDYVRAVRSF